MAATRARKLCMLGARAVGKSTITVQFAENHFAEGYNPTIENTFTQTLRHRGVQYQLEIVDTAGHDEFTLFNSAHAVGVHGYILAFAVNSKQSFEIAQVINDKLLNALGVETFPRVLVGNKTDLHTDRVISTAQGQELAEEWGCPYVEVSGKHNDGVEDLFCTIIDEIDKTETPPPPPPPEKNCVLI